MTGPTQQPPPLAPPLAVPPVDVAAQEAAHAQQNAPDVVELTRQLQELRNQMASMILANPSVAVAGGLAVAGGSSAGIIPQTQTHHFTSSSKIVVPTLAPKMHVVPAVSFEGEIHDVNEVNRRGQMTW